MKINKKKGILFWITGLSGSGKTTIANKIKKDISKKYGPTIILNGDDIRKIFYLKKFDRRYRLKLALSYSKLCKFISDQKINIIFPTVSMFNKVRNYNRKNIKNYFEIYIKTNVKKIIKKKKKKIYYKSKINIVGLDIKPELPKKPDIIILNNFDKNLKVISKNLIKKINLKLE